MHLKMAEMAIVMCILTHKKENNTQPDMAVSLKMKGTNILILTTTKKPSKETPQNQCQ